MRFNYFINLDKNIKIEPIPVLIESNKQEAPLLTRQKLYYRDRIKD